jgi:hypothetical protein
MKIKVNVRDKQKVVDTLKAEGYPEATLNSFIKTIKLEFMAYANLAYLEILRKTPPQLITVNLVNKESDENQFMTISFLSQKSNNDHLLFEIHQPFIKRVLDNPTDRTYATTMIHEMMHAADLTTTERIDEVLNRFESKLNNDSNAYSFSLLHTLQMLKRLRADSIAQLGKFLLAQMKMGVPVNDLFASFRQSFDIAISKAILGLSPTKDFPYETISIDDSRHLSDYAGPCILLLSLDKMGLVKSELIQEAIQGFQTGHYLEKQNTMALLRAALSLSFADFIKGLLLVGEEYVPVRTILEYCTLLQKNGKEDNMEALLVLLEQPQSATTFNQVVGQIIGNEVLTKDLDYPYQDFCMDLPNPIDYPSLKSNVSTLYLVMKKSENAAKRQIARNALAYFFAEEKAINNRILGFGRVDDLIVIDYATNLLRNCAS